MSMNRPDIEQMQTAMATSLHEHWRLFLVEGIILVILGENGLVGEKDACRVIVDRTAVQQLPWFTVRVNRPIADDPRVKKVQAL